MNLSKDYWENRYLTEETGWDIGYVSTPIKTYLDQLEDKSIMILIPGAGNAHEAEYAFKSGFKNTFIIDLSQKAIQNIKTRVPEFPDSQLIFGDFFDLEMKFDLILEQTFFCAIHPKLRSAYAKKMTELLKPSGKLVGLLFNATLNTDKPPFGGDPLEYQNYFEPYFDMAIFEAAHNSIPERANRELFIKFNLK